MNKKLLMAALIVGSITTNGMAIDRDSVLKTEQDKMSYFIGIDSGSMIHGMMPAGFKLEAFIKSCSSGFNEAKGDFSDLNAKLKIEKRLDELHLQVLKLEEYPEQNRAQLAAIQDELNSYQAATFCGQVKLASPPLSLKAMIRGFQDAFNKVPSLLTDKEGQEIAEKLQQFSRDFYS